MQISARNTQASFIHNVLIILLFAVAFWFQQHTFFNWDASWHLEGAKRMLQGGNYPNEIFDDNLPMVFWFFTPSVLLHNLFHFNLITLTNIQVDFFLLLTIVLCNRYLKWLYPDDKTKKILIVYAALILLFFFPGSEFAQRDMLVTLFCLPYIFLIAAKIESSQNTVPVGIDGANRSLQTQTQKSKFNRYFGQFLTHLQRPVRPINANEYSPSSYLQLFTGIWAAIGIAMNPFYGLIILALEIQLWCCTKKLLLLRLETITFSILIFLYLCAIALFYPHYYTTIIPAFITFSAGYSIYDATFSTLLYIKFPAMLVTETIVLYALLFRSNSVKGLPLSLLICTVVSYIVFLINGKNFTSHIIFLVFTANLFFFIVMLHTKTQFKNNLIYLGGFVLGSYCIIMSALLTYSNNQLNYHSYKNSNDFLNQFIVFFKNVPKNSTVYVFSSSTQIAFPLIDYASITYLPRWPNAWMATLLGKNDSQKKLQGWKAEWITHYKNTFINEIANDFSQKKPDYVIVNMTQNNASTDNPYNDIAFNYFSFLTQNIKFKNALKNYQLQKMIEGYAIYKKINTRQLLG